MSDEINENNEIKAEETPVVDTPVETPVETKPAKVKKERKPFHFGVKFEEGYGKLQSSIPVLIITCVLALVLMLFVTLVVFFNNVQGPEKVLVPNVIGKNLEDALLEMQVKELYPKINLRYSDLPGDE